MKRREFKIEDKKFSVSDVAYDANWDTGYKYTVDVKNDGPGWTKIAYCNTIADGKELAQDWFYEHKRMGDF